jgi:CubicO group peptidase (beta-lactamase class C family)
MKPMPGTRYTSTTWPLLALTLLVAALCSTPALAGVNDSLRHDNRTIPATTKQLIEQTQRRYNIKGLSVALVDQQEVVWAEGFGYADVARKIPASPETIYRAGSLAKLFTATAVMQLEDQVEIDIDQPVFAYLPGFSTRSRFNETAQPITVRSMLTHHSGLPTDLSKGMWTNEPFTRVAHRLNNEYTSFPPDLVYSYSNVGYTLLGHMVQEVSGLEFQAYMDTNILGPLGMEHTAFVLSPELEPLLAAGYKKNKSVPLLPIRDLPAMSLYSNVLDLSHFMMMYMGKGSLKGNKVLSSASIDEMLEIQNADIPLDMNVRVGLGWFIEDDTIPGAGTVVRHGGTTVMFNSEMIMLPEQQLGIVIMTNTSDSRQVISRLAEEILEIVLQADSGAGQVAEQPLMVQPKDEFVPVDSAGKYATELGMIAMHPDDKKMCACIIDKKLDLVSLPGSWFGLNKDSINMLPPEYQVFGDLQFATRSIAGREVMIVRRDGEIALLGEKVNLESVPLDWEARVGKYEILNPDAGFPFQDLEIWQVNGSLGISYRLPLLSGNTVRVPIQHLSENEAVILGLGRTRGDTIHVFHDDNGEERVRYSGYIARKLSN